ncbi:MAG TPA: hypothetical protein VK157_16510 [Phycisphaerales bacterium]|nr:hypothetical protein [Phycisphaerales bacterium]
MPPIAAIRHPVLASLEAQLRLAKREAIVRDIERIERLVGDVEPERSYPFDWVVFRITGFRPDDVRDGAMSGAELLADACALCETLCARVNMTLAECAEREPVTLAQLRERWHVSEATIKRLRRSGLVTRRVDDGQQTISVAMRGVVEAFEARNPQLAQPVSKPKRYDDALKAKLVRRASAYMRKLGWSVFRCAQRLAQQEGLSEEGVRQLLLRELEPGQSVPEISLRRAGAMWRMHRLGVEVSHLAEVTRRSTAVVRREMNLARLATLQRVVTPAVSAVPVERAAAALAHGHVVANLRTPWPQDLLELLADWRQRSPITPAMERAQAVAFAALRERAIGALGSLDRLQPRASTLDEVETMLRHATLVQRELVRSQHRLLIETIDMRVGHAVEQWSAWRVIALLREATAAAAEASLQFDPMRGGRLAAVVGIAADKAVTRIVRNWLPAHATASRRAQAILGPGVLVPDLAHGLNPWQKFTDPDWRVSRGVLTGTLSEQHARLLIARFGLLGSAPRTRADVASELRLDEIRYAHAEAAAIRQAVAAV